METSVPVMANCCGVQEKSRDKSKYLRWHTELANHNTTKNPSPKTKWRVQNGDRKRSNMSDCMKEEQHRKSNFDKTDRNCQPVGGRHVQGCF
jgi:hypothetical protein